jgi:hypothetical protein
LDTAARQLDRPPRLHLIAVGVVATAVAREGGRTRIGEPDAQRPELKLPDMAEFVHDEVLIKRRAFQEDEMSRGVSAEAAKAGDTEQPRRDDEANAAKINWLGVELQPVQPRLRAFEQLAAIHAPASSGLGSQKTKMMSRITMRIAAPTLMYILPLGSVERHVPTACVDMH